MFDTPGLNYRSLCVCVCVWWINSVFTLTFIKYTVRLSYMFGPRRSLGFKFWPLDWLSLTLLTPDPSPLSLSESAITKVQSPPTRTSRRYQGKAKSIRPPEPEVDVQLLETLCKENDCNAEEVRKSDFFGVFFMSLNIKYFSVFVLHFSLFHLIVPLQVKNVYQNSFSAFLDSLDLSRSSDVPQVRCQCLSLSLSLSALVHVYSLRSLMSGWCWLKPRLGGRTRTVMTTVETGCHCLLTGFSVTLSRTARCCCVATVTVTGGGHLRMEQGRRFKKNPLWSDNSVTPE